VLALSLLCASPGGAQSPSSQANLDAQLAANMARGDLLYAYDQSAWHVTDAMLKSVTGQARALVRGYITIPDPQGYRTTFFGENGDRHFKLYSAVWTGRAITAAQTFLAADNVPLSDEENRLIAAKKIATAKTDGIMVCGEANPNTIVIPGATLADAISVYVLTPQTKLSAFPLGGHNRIDVLDGRVISTRQFTRSCISLDKASVPDKATPTGMFINHLLDPIPTEIHAFTVHAAQVPLYVGVRSGEAFAVEVRGGKANARRIRGK
jgi:hypothetical protein